MLIENSVALPGEDVLVRNYRCRPPRWDHGTVSKAEYSSRSGVCGFDWAYEVWISRPTGGYCIYVSGRNDLRKADL